MHIVRVLTIVVTLCGVSAEKCCPNKDGTPNDVSDMDEYPNLTCDCGPGYDNKYPDVSADGPAPPQEVTCIKHPVCNNQDGDWNQDNSFAPASTCLCTEPKRRRAETDQNNKYRVKCIPECELDKEFAFANVDDCFCITGPNQPTKSECNFADPSNPADDDKCVCTANPDYKPPADGAKKTKRTCDASDMNGHTNSGTRIGNGETSFVVFILTSLITSVINIVNH